MYSETCTRTGARTLNKTLIEKVKWNLFLDDFWFLIWSILYVGVLNNGNYLSALLSNF